MMSEIPPPPGHISKIFTLRLNVASILEADDLEQNITTDDSFPNTNSFGNPLLPKPLDRKFPFTTYDNYTQDNEYYSLCTKICNRESMEDRVHVVPFNTSDMSNPAYFAIFDGHTNCYVAEYLQYMLYNKIMAVYSRDKQLLPAISRTFREVNDEVLSLLSKGGLPGGSTALTAFISADDKVTIANVGDCRAFRMNAEGKITILTTDHRLSTESERQAAIAKGATVIQKNNSKYLLEGSLSVSRAFGDLNYKDYIHAEPECFEFTIAEDDRLLILATDGFWELTKDLDELSKVLSNGLANSKKTASTGASNTTKCLAARVVDYYIEKCQNVTKDNIALILIDLPHIKALKTTTSHDSVEAVQTTLSSPPPSLNPQVSGLSIKKEVSVEETAETSKAAPGSCLKKPAFSGGFKFSMNEGEDSNEEIGKKEEEAAPDGKKNLAPSKTPNIKSPNMFTFA